VSATREARKAAVSYTGTRPLPEVLERVRASQGTRVPPQGRASGRGLDAPVGAATVL